MTVALVISVYKDISNLKVILDALRYQTYKEFEIVISEDGDFPEMQKFISTYPFANPVKHITQIDEGWRKNKALNKSILSTSSEYLIFIDGDCVPHHKFIESHVMLSGLNHIVAGKRVKLGAGYSQLFKQQNSDYLHLEKAIAWQWWGMRMDGARFYEEAIYISPQSIMGFIPRLRSMYQLKGCNMSFYKSAIEAINGFDEDYKLPAIGEDIDLTWRFQGAGYRLVSARNLAVQYHLHHKENWNDQSENISIMQKKMNAKEYICKNGLVKQT